MVWKKTKRLFNEMVREAKWPTISGEAITIQIATKTTENLPFYRAVLVFLSRGIRRRTQRARVYESLKLQGDNLILFSSIFYA
jgi:hypothetical protein